MRMLIQADGVRFRAVVLDETDKAALRHELESRAQAIYDVLQDPNVGGYEIGTPHGRVLCVLE